MIFDFVKNINCNFFLFLAMKYERYEMEPLLSHSDIPPGRRLYFLCSFSKSPFSSYPNEIHGAKKSFLCS